MLIRIKFSRVGFADEKFHTIGRCDGVGSHTITSMTVLRREAVVDQFRPPKWWTYFRRTFHLLYSEKTKSPPPQ